MFELRPDQKKALANLRNGSILCGGVGSGKSIVSLAYYYTKICDGSIDPWRTKTKGPQLYIITTAMKRDTFEWEDEACRFLMNDMIIDSWNNIKKYADVSNAFFIFDEQRVVGWGAWSKTFVKIARKNRWILLSATPGDKWEDYGPVFVANGFYRNITDFRQSHFVYSRYTKYPKVTSYMNQGRLIFYRNQILVPMDYKNPAESHYIDISCGYNKDDFTKVYKYHWNIYEDCPIVNGSEWCKLQRMLVNSDPRRIEEFRKLAKENPKAIVFYNFDYELEILRKVANEESLIFAEWNGHKHEPIPDTDSWLYFVQYNGSEGWNCIKTNVIIFYSLNYSYRTMKQAAGRIDRSNTPFKHLYFYRLKSNSPIDNGIAYAVKRKKDFNESSFIGKKFNNEEVARKTQLIIEGERE